MHLRKTRKAKAAASEFVKRVISGKDVSPDRRDVSTSKTSKPSTTKQSTKGAASSSKSVGRGRPCSPRTTQRSGAATSRRSNSRSPSRAPESKSKTQAHTAKAESPVPSKRRGRPPKTQRSESPATKATKDAQQEELDPLEKKIKDDKSKEQETTSKKKPKTKQSSPAAKVVPTAKGKSTQGISTKTSGASTKPEKKDDSKDSKEISEKVSKEISTKTSKSDIKDEVEEIEERTDNEKTTQKSEENENMVGPSSSVVSTDVSESKPVSTPPIASVDEKNERKAVSSPTSCPSSMSPQHIGKIQMSPFSSLSPIRISPTAKLIPVSSLSDINTAGKSIYAISIPGPSLAKSIGQGGQGAQFIVNAQPVGSLGASPIKLTATCGSSPGQVMLDFAELAKSITGVSPQKRYSPEICEVKQEEMSAPSTPIINKSPKFLLSSQKTRKEPISEGKIKKRRRPKVPGWDVPSAIYKTNFEQPQPKFNRKDDEISYPGNSNMEQGDYFKIMGIISKADIKKTDGTEHRNHRHAGGKLRRVCKPKISPEMVYRRFSFARGCIMHDVFVESDEDHGDGSHSPRVADKHAILKTEQCKKGSLGPKIQDSYRQHCNKIPVITIEKVQKEGATSDGETDSPNKSGKTKDSDSPLAKRKCDFGSDEVSSSNMPRQNRRDILYKKSSQSPKTKAKFGAKKQLDLKQGCGKLLAKSKSFEVSSKTKSNKPLSMTKSKSFEKGSTTPTKSDNSKGKIIVPKIEPEEDDGTTRRSARNRGGKRKQWWHLLRANPDEFEEDKEWDKEIAMQEQKRKARLERARERAEEEEESEEEVKEEVVEKEPPKKSKKKSKAKKEPDSEGEGMEKIDSPDSKAKNKKKRPKDGASVKKVQEETQTETTVKEEPSEGSSHKSKKINKKESSKRKATDGAMEEPSSKKVKTEPLSVPNSDDESSQQNTETADKKATKLKKKKSIGSTEPEEPADEKPEMITNLVILGENGEPLRAKDNSNLYDQLQSMLEGKDAEKLTRTGVLELSALPQSPQSFIEILAREQQKTKKRSHSPLGMLPIVRGDVLYKTKEGECIAPHMCSVCWINDHMYCRNMKRIARDLPLCGGCIHYVPCHHYRQKESPSTVDRKHVQRSVRRSLYTIDNSNDSSKTVLPVNRSCPFTSPTATRKINFSEEKFLGSPGDPLMCDEILTESDSEPNSPEAPPPPGTELLKAELRARAHQIKRSLGFKSLPQTISPLKRKLQWTSPGRAVDLTLESSSEDEDAKEVAIMEFGREESVGETLETDYGVPLSQEYLVKESEIKKESWSTGSSIFMPNTESDASNDSCDMIAEPEPNTATELTYEESVFGENSQDSTETSLSQNSNHADSEDSEDDSLIGQPPVSHKGERRRKKKKKRSSDIINIKPMGSESEVAFEGLKDKWQQGEDGTQVLTFTTKEIRERKPELLNYIKRSGLVSVITEKLCHEKNSIKKLVKEHDVTMRQSQDRLEQQRCLMAAVLTEILSVKEQLRDLQTVLVDEESICSKSRKEYRDMDKKCMEAEAKVNILKKIMTQATTKGLIINENMAASESDSSIEEPTLTQTVPASREPEVVTDVVVEDTTQLPVDSLDNQTVEGVVVEETMEASEEPLDRVVVESTDIVSSDSQMSPEVGGSVTVDNVQPVVAATEPEAAAMEIVQDSPVPQEISTQEVIADADQVVVETEQNVQTENVQNLNYQEECVSNEQITYVSEAEPVQTVTSIPYVSKTEASHMTSIPESAQELTVMHGGQMVSVTIDGGHSDAHSVVLELPKDLLQHQTGSSKLETVTDSLGNATVVEMEQSGEEPAVAQLQQVQMLTQTEDVQEEAIGFEDVPPAVATMGTTVLEAPQEVVAEDITVKQPQDAVVEHPEDTYMEVQESMVQQQTVEVPVALSQSGMLENIPEQVQVIDSVAGTQFTQVISESTDMTNSVLPQQAMETSLKQGAADFDSMIMRPGDLGDMILQTSDMGTLSLQQGEMGSLVVQQGEIPLTMDAAGLNAFLANQPALDEGMLVQQEVSDNFVIQQQQEMVQVEKPVYIQTTNNGTVFVQTSNTAPLQTTTNANVMVQSSNHQNIVVQQQQQQPQQASTLQQGLQNIILQTDDTQNLLVQEPAAVTVESTPNTNVVTQQAQDIVLQNMDFVQGLGQVQTVMIDGQPYQVILQSAEST